MRIAFLIIAIAIIGLLGCGEDEPEPQPPSIVIPTQAMESRLTDYEGLVVVIFSQEMDPDSVKIQVWDGDKLIPGTVTRSETRKEVSETLEKFIWRAETCPHISGDQATVIIEGRSKMGLELIGDNTFYFDVRSGDPPPPIVLKSAPWDGDRDLEPEDLMEYGIYIRFTRAIASDITFTFEPDWGELALNWSEDREEVTIKSATNTIPQYDATYTLVIDNFIDLFGLNCCQTTITFTTRKME